MTVHKPTLSFVLVLIISCHHGTPDNGTNEEARKKAIEKMAAKTKNGLDSLVCDNKKDLVCNMPLGAGIGDTLHYKGKLYGFCSKECKEEFIKQPSLYDPEFKQDKTNNNVKKKTHKG